MNETLILAAIMAPLVLVPAIIVSFMSHVDGLYWPVTEIAFPAEAESGFAQFEREMIEQMCRALAIPKEMLAAPYASCGSSFYAESLKHYRRFGGWL